MVILSNFKEKNKMKNCMHNMSTFTFNMYVKILDDKILILFGKVV